MRKLLMACCLFLFVSTASAGTYYIDYATGADTNNGTAKVTPWKRMPGMQGCANSCASHIPVGDDQFILKGGITWPNAALGVDWVWSGTSGHTIYIGVDQTWYTGGSWARPIFDAGGSAVAHNNIMLSVYGWDYIVVDNIEFKGFYWTGSPAFATTSMTTIGAHDEFKNLYMHGWSHGTYPGTDDLGACGVVGDTHVPNQGVGSSFHDSVIDGFDTDGGNPVQASCGGVFGGPPIIYNNVFRYLSNGIIGNGLQQVHDNFFEHINDSFNPGTHENCFEDNASQNLYFYNNVCINQTAPVNWWFAPDQGYSVWAWNNVASNISFGPINIAHPVSNNGCPTVPATGYCVNAGSYYLWNNTVECGPDSNPNLQCGGISDSTIDGLQAQNNHFITSNVAPFLCGTNCTQNNNLTQSKAAANTQGYTAAQMYAFSPTNVTNSTVGAGVNFTVQCLSSLISLCQDATYGVSYNNTNHTVSYPFRTTSLRPAGSAWDIGAYQFAGGSTPSPAIRPKVNNSSLPGGIVGVPYSFALTAVDGSPPYNWTPASFSNGLALSAAGVLAGTPNANGNYIVPVTVNDTKGLSDTAALPLVIAQFTPPLSTKYAIGDTFKVVTDGGRLNVRVCPNGAKVSTMNNGATAQITGQAQVSSGATYWPMSRGCVPDIYIRQ